MAMSIRIPREKEKMIEEYARKRGMTKTSVILEAVDEKLGISGKSEDRLRNLAGWMSRKEAEQLREALAETEQIHPGDWE